MEINKDNHMTDERYKQLMDDESLELTEDEIEAGWHFCFDFDFLLVGPGMSELHSCKCLDGNHPAYKTAPKINNNPTI